MKPRIYVNFNHRLRKAFWVKSPQYKPHRNVFLLNHARSGLLLALQALHLPPHTKVGMMVYNCHTVMNAIAQAGCEPVFLDVDNHLRIDTADLQKKSEGLCAIIISHLFGIENDIANIHRICPKAVVIEDCAHAFGKEIAGDFGVYSIGQGKLPSLGDGGILIVHNELYLNRIETLYTQLPTYSLPQEIALFCKLFLTSLLHHRWIYGLFTRHWKSHRRTISGKESIVIKKMSPRVLSMYTIERDILWKQKEIQRRNAEKIKSDIWGNPSIDDVFYGETPFMLVAHCKDVDAIKHYFAAGGVETATHFAYCILWANAFGYRGDCPNAETAVNTLLMIPIY